MHVARLPRWSKRTDELVRQVALRCRPGLQSELGHWLENRPRFRAFITANQDKVRKKLTTASDEESRLDVRSELHVAYLILADRRFELSFEAYGARRLGPDLTVTFRANQRFNLEVTRLRAVVDARPAGEEPGPAIARLANVITGKLRQLPGDVPNALVISTQGLALSEAHVAAAARLLKMYSNQQDDLFFARRGFFRARDFSAHYRGLSGVFVLDEVTGPPGVVFTANREARHPLPKEAVAGLTVCLTSARGVTP
jgi:hypothetical protein